MVMIIITIFTAIEEILPVNSEKSSRPLILAANQHCEIEWCDQGQEISLHLGQLSIRMPLNLFQRLEAAVTEASQILDCKCRPMQAGDLPGGSTRTRFRRH